MSAVPAIAFPAGGESRARVAVGLEAAGRRLHEGILDAIDIQFAVLDLNGRIVATSAAWRRFAKTNGLDWESVESDINYLEICDRADGSHVGDAQATETGIRDVIAGRRRDFIYEYPCESPDERHWFLCRVSRFSAEGTDWLLVVHENVTAIREARERIPAEEHKQASLARTSPVGIFRIDAEERCTEANDRWLDIAGLARGEIPSADWMRTIHPEDRPRVAEAWAAAVRDRAAYHDEWRFRHGDGAEVSVVCQAVEIAPADEVTTGRIGTLTDVTVRKSLEAQLAQARKMESIGRLAGGVAHDFNNQLTVVIGNLGLLQEHAAGDPLATQYADAALHGASRCAKLTQSLLAFARRQPLVSCVCDVGTSVAEAVMLLEHALGKDIDIGFSRDKTECPVLVDESQLGACIVNLASNARDAMPSGGTLTVAVRNVVLSHDGAVKGTDLVARAYVVVEITDTGTGIPPEILEKAFDPFFTTKDVGKGTGLGLSMVHGFAKQSGGDVVIDSEVGRGTTVWIYLPRAAEAR